ncbi:MAG: flagellar basal body rod protein FlgB [Wolinella sp.]
MSSIFSYSPARDIAHKALDYRSLRQDMISSNIANVDTPMYRPRDISFEETLAAESQKLFSAESNKKLALGQTNSVHFPALEELDSSRGTIFFRDGHMARNDGNSVDLDVESSELGKNGVMYQGIIGSLKKHGSIFSYALESSKSL